MSWTKEKQREYYKKYAEANREKLKRYKAEWQKNNKQRIKIEKRNYYFDNIEYFREKRKLDYIKNKDRYIKSVMEWRNRNLEKVRLYTLLNQHKRRCSGKITVAIVSSLHAENVHKYGVLTCELCGNPILQEKASIDHKIPVCRGGDNSKDNLCLSHRVCNTRKNRKTYEEFLNEQLN